MAKDIRKIIRFSQTEWKNIETILIENNINFSEFARKKMTGGRVLTAPKKELIYELNKIGINLNQLVKSTYYQDDKNIKELTNKLTVLIDKVSKEWL